MKLRKLHKSDSKNGCGPAALKVLFGKTTKYWQQQILNYRKNHLPPRSSVSYRMADVRPTSRHDRSVMKKWTYDNEMRAILSREFGKKIRFKQPEKPTILLMFQPIPASGTYLIMLSEHFVVMQQGKLYDGGSFCEHRMLHRYKLDEVESYVRLPDYETIPQRQCILERNFEAGRQYYDLLSTVDAILRARRRRK